MNPIGRWHMAALAGATALLCSMASFDASALGLGRITVQSALGEPLRAEIDVADISAAEAGSLRAGVASAEAFKAAGLEYTTAVADVKVDLQKRADGRAYLRLTSSRPVTEPFVDLVLEASWASGRIVRDYTMLFDPPSLRQSGNAGAAQAPLASTAPSLSRPAPPPASTANVVPPAPPMAPPMARPAPPVRAAPAKAPVAEARGQQVTVRSGDTASKIAAQNKPASVSLDQMLVALLKSNPDAFTGGNINRLKSGAVLDIPGADQAVSVSAGDASRTIVAQAKDFNEFRRQLAQSAPATRMDSANRQSGGKVQAQVDDRKPATTTPDKLTLSKGAVQGKATAAEEKIAKERQNKEASDRVAELSRNIGDLNKLAAAPVPSTAPAAPAAATASAAKIPGAALPKPTGLPSPITAASDPVLTSPSKAAPSAVAPASPAASAVVVPTPAAAASTAAASTPVTSPAATASATAPASLQTAAGAASAAAPATVAKKPAVVTPPPPPPAEPGLLDAITDNPLVLPALGGLLLLIGGLGFYRYKKGKGSAQVDSSFLESRLQPDSFFGASGGQRIDTNDGAATGSSLVYSPSQLDAVGDVDPVAEADVYLAYGRDLQAEEILKEAIRTTPKRVAIHTKLMEIYAKRRDVKAFEVVAIEAFNLTRGDGPDWSYVGEMGRELDPGNPMYQPGGQPQTGSKNSAAADQNKDKAAAFYSSTLTQGVQPPSKAPSKAADFDIDLDFSLDDEPVVTLPVVAAAPVRPAVPVPVPAPAPAATPAPAPAMRLPQDPIFEGLDMDFSTDADAKATSTQAGKGVAVETAASANRLDFSIETPAKPAPAMVTRVSDAGMMEFDLNSLSLDLAGPTTESPLTSAPASGADDPLETKFALAEEFRALGDREGARSLAEEVLAQAQGTLKSKTQAFLNAL